MVVGAKVKKKINETGNISGKEKDNFCHPTCQANYKASLADKGARK